MIGAGHAGLVAAIHLAAAGLEVTILEHAPRPGGATASSARTLPGFVHDDHAAFVPMAVASPAMQELELERDELRWMHACGDEVRAGRLAGDDAVGILQSTIRSVFIA
ncbi:MAG: hypothetical protein QOK49_2813 [Baekduia sp.]|nr:hypothetical protein [Baekduia sp.]